MRRLRFVPLLLATAVLLAARCAKTNESKTEMKLQTTTTTAQGTTERKTEATQAHRTSEPGGPCPRIATQMPSRAAPIGCATIRMATGCRDLLLRPPRKSPTPHDAAAARARAAANT